MKRIIDFTKGLSKRVKGILLSGVFSLTVLFYFFGPILSSPNKYYFDKNGDGLLCYYYATYQLKYDSAYWHINASNYPYGESVFFSSDQPLITATLKFVNNNLFSTEDSVAGIFNLLMLFSFCICAIFLFLILYEFNTPYIFAALASVGIAFLSPQWVRILAHFPLSYAFVIPVLLYLLIRFNKTPSLKRSLGIGLFVLFAACLHIYFIGFCGVILTVYFFIKLFSRSDKNFTFFKKCGFYLIQLILPYVVLQGCIYLTSNVSDRTNNPWGFLFYISNYDGIFYPYGKPYSSFLSKYYAPHQVEQYEGLSYVGLFGIITILVFFLRKIFQLVSGKFKDLFVLSEYKMLNIYVLTGIIAAIYACGIPYIFNPELVQYSGPLRQMRGLGRFAWVLFYVLNIFGIYYLSKMILFVKHKYIRVILYAIPLGILSYDAYCNVEPISKSIANKIPQLEDIGNLLPENKWVNEIDVKRYQAIIPLPYFLLGSENVGVEPKRPEIVGLTYMVSLKTGLPTTAAVLSRTSLSQTYENLPMVLEEYRPLRIAKNFPNEKPFLLVVRDAEINDFEKNLVSKAIYLRLCDGFNLYELPYSALANYSDSLYSKTLKQFSAQKTFAIDGWMFAKSEKNFVYKSFDDHKSTYAYHGKGAHEWKIRDYNRIFEDTIPGAKAGQDFLMSFWMNYFNKDLYPRTTLEVTYLDSATGAAYNSIWTNPAMYLKTLDGSWALIELPLKPTHGHDKVLITLWNPNFYDDSKLIIDEFLIRPVGSDLYRIFPCGIEKNNRFYRENNF